MEARATRTEGSPQTVEAIRSRLSDATRKWRESASILCEVRRDVAHYLALKRASDMHLRRAGRKRSLDCPESRARAERLFAATEGLPFDELRRIFIKVDHLVNLPIAKDRAAAACMLLPSLDGFPCRVCGNSLPLGRRKVCSEACRKNTSGRPELLQQGPELGAPSHTMSGAECDGLEPNPLAGMGGRNLDCDFYEACLDLAILEEWESFRCDACDLKGPQEQLAMETFDGM